MEEGKKNDNIQKISQKRINLRFWEYQQVYECAWIVIIAFILHMLVRFLILEIFYVPTGSMIPTIAVGDHILVTKYSYGYGRYTTFFDLGLRERILVKAEPQRGEVVIFRSIMDKEKTYIKRLIGLPGDRIKVNNGEVILNGKPLKRTDLGNFDVTRHNGSEEKIVHCTRYIEELPNGTRYYTLIDHDSALDQFPNTTDEYVVPSGHYFMMGDNRNYSVDSRFTQQMGMIPSANLQGQARQVLYNGSMFEALRKMDKMRELAIEAEVNE